MKQSEASLRRDIVGIVSILKDHRVQILESPAASTVTSLAERGSELLKLPEFPRSDVEDFIHDFEQLAMSVHEIHLRYLHLIIEDFERRIAVFQRDLLDPTASEFACKVIPELTVLLEFFRARYAELNATSKDPGGTVR